MLLVDRIGLSVQVLSLGPAALVHSIGHAMVVSGQSKGNSRPVWCPAQVKDGSTTGRFWVHHCHCDGCATAPLWTWVQCGVLIGRIWGQP